MRTVVLMLLVAGCLPSFDLEDRTFAPRDGGVSTEGDARPDDVGDAASVDAGLEDAEPKDRGADPDASEMDDGGENDAGPREICDNGEDDDDDGATDCADQECTVSVCPDDQNVCTRPICIAPDGICDVEETGASGSGWMCVGTARRETSCEDGTDNDGDGDPDCKDNDCPSCLGMLLCCPAGNCALVCD